MRTIRIDASSGYDVLIGNGILDSLGEKLSEFKDVRKIMLVSDDTVFGLYGKRVCGIIEKAGFRVSMFVFPHGEDSKNLATYGQLLEKALADNFSRSDMFVSLGGGVVGDLAGFAAATFKRGIRFAQIPTTLLSMIDASVGGKTAVDLPGGKNQVGAFHQPSAVIADVSVLETLPEEEFRSGMAEVIKTAVIRDSGLFETVYNIDGDNCIDEDIIARTVGIKKYFVQDDEFDRGSRMMLNFGHTVGHAIEAASGYTVRHGYAVAAGMAIISRAACNRGYCDDTVPSKIEKILEKYGLPDSTEYRSDTLLPYVCGDKKAAAGHISLIVPREIGRCEAVKVKVSEMEEWILDGGVK